MSSTWRLRSGFAVGLSVAERVRAGAGEGACADRVDVLAAGGAASPLEAPGLAFLGVQGPPERRCSGRIELGQGLAQRVEARGAGELVLLDGAADERRYRGVFGVGADRQRPEGEAEAIPHRPRGLYRRRRSFYPIEDASAQSG